MQKNWQGILEVKSYRFSKQQLTIKATGSLLQKIASSNTTAEKSRGQNCRFSKPVVLDPLYQIYITWQDITWQTQLKNQRERIISNIFKSISQDQYQSKRETIIYEYQREPLFVITWQQETGDGRRIRKMQRYKKTTKRR